MHKSLTWTCLFVFIAIVFCLRFPAMIAPPPPMKMVSLHQAAVFDSQQIAELVAAEADVNQLNQDGQTPLWTAVRMDQPRAVRALIENGADVNLAGEGTEPPILTATFMCHSPADIEIVRVLIDAGADVNTHASRYSETPLHYAGRSGLVTICQALIEAGADVNAVSSSGDTALQSAVSRGLPEVARLLLANGADPEIRNHVGFRPIDQLNACPNPEELRAVFREAGFDDVRRPELIRQHRVTAEKELDE